MRNNNLINSKDLEQLRDRKEIINYFKQKGIKINEQELESLKNNYQQEQNDFNTLSLEQLKNIVGGFFYVKVLFPLNKQAKIEIFSTERKNAKNYDPEINYNLSVLRSFMGHREMSNELFYKTVLNKFEHDDIVVCFSEENERCIRNSSSKLSIKELAGSIEDKQLYKNILNALSRETATPGRDEERERGQIAAAKTALEALKTLESKEQTNKTNRCHRSYSVSDIPYIENMARDIKLFRRHNVSIKTEDQFRHQNFFSAKTIAAAILSLYVVSNTATFSALFANSEDIP